MRTEPSAGNSFRIGDLARRAGCSVPTIRYYEEIGLIPRAARGSSGHRAYDNSAIELLGFIRRCRDFGFTIEQTRAIVSLADGRSRACLEARDIAQEHLKTVREKMLELLDLERSLSRFVDACTSLCADGPAPKCTILRDLGLKRSRAGCCV
ncbi:MAG TPA: helix-turn-helix domain-containing protein [Burkholderiales bacterium]|nr:helix-turn-helix domain-containing protein [Burkholderiales bacterium]